MRKYEDPTEARIRRDKANPIGHPTQKDNVAKGMAKSAFRDAAGKGKPGAVKTTEAVYRASGRDPKRVL